MPMLVTLGEWAAVAAAIDSCRQQVRQCERSWDYHVDEEGRYEEGEEFESDTEYLGELISQAHCHMQILIERSQLPLFYSDYMKGFSEFDGKLGNISHVPQDPDIMYSEALNYIDRRYSALSAMMNTSAADVSGLALFEKILRQAPYILQDRDINPLSEKEVRQPVFDVLKTVFSDCRREVPVSHLFKVYKGDVAVPSLKAMAEFKFAVDEKELKSEIDGIFADMRGYSGDPQWSHFFAVFYTAAPIAAPERLLEEFKLARADLSWTPIIVHGPGARQPKRVERETSTTPKVRQVSRRGRSSVSAKRGAPER